MATTNQHPGLTHAVQRNEPIGHDVPSDEKPTMPAPPMRRKGRIVVLSCLLLVTAGTAALAQWLTPPIAAAEARREGRAPDALAAHATSAGSSVHPLPGGWGRDAEAPSVNEGLPVAPGEYAPARPESQPKRKVRESDALVRDGYRLLLEHPALARQLFEVAVAIDARNPHAHAGRASALRRMNKPLEARAAIEQALRIRPKRALYHALLAVLDAESFQPASAAL